MRDLAKLTLLLLTALLPVVAGVVPARAERPANVSIVNSEGDVSILRKGKSLKPFYNENTPLERYDVVKTGPDAFMEIVVADGFGVRFYDSTEFTVLSVLDTSLFLKMNAGGAALINSLKMSDGFKFVIETPHAKAAIKKAQCWIGVSPDGPVDDAVTFGLVKGEMTVTVDRSGAAIGVPLECALDVAPETYVPPLRQLTPGESEILRDVHTIPTEV